MGRPVARVLEARVPFVWAVDTVVDDGADSGEICIKFIAIHISLIV